MKKLVSSILAINMMFVGLPVSASAQEVEKNNVLQKQQDSCLVGDLYPGVRSAVNTAKNAWDTLRECGVNGTAWKNAVGSAVSNMCVPIKDCSSDVEACWKEAREQIKTQAVVNDYLGSQRNLLATLMSYVATALPWIGFWLFERFYIQRSLRRQAGALEADIATVRAALAAEQRANTHLAHVHAVSMETADREVTALLTDIASTFTSITSKLQGDKKIKQAITDVIKEFLKKHPNVG